MLKRIHLMPTLLANQIAAGEVVERPASVVKELLENSLDANAKMIHIDIEGGGIDLIKIRDDGHGIEKDDLPLALSRHATSKIYTLDDLQHIASLGFRGEALASIAAVSHFKLTSRAVEAEHAWSVRHESATQQIAVEPAAHPQGTTIEIHNLFYNTPARRKFLRSEKTELGHIETVVKQIALSRPDVQFTLRHKQATLLHAKNVATNTAATARVAAICGHVFVKHAIELDCSDGIIHLQGWIGTGEAARSHTDLQYFYVNGRIVRDKLINHAIKMAYQDQLYEGKHPAYVLYLNLPADAVDVNVHPTKHEVRFYESRQIHDFIVFHLERSLQGQTALALAPQTELELTKANVSAVSTPVHYSKPTLNTWTQLGVQETVAEYNTAVVIRPYDTVKSSPPLKPLIGKIISFKKPFLWVETQEGWLVIHTLCAKQAVTYEKLITASKEKTLIGQPLLLPVSFNLSVILSEKLEAYTEHLTLWGIKIARLGDERWVIRELPAILKEANIAEALEELLAIEWSQDKAAMVLTQYLSVTEFFSYKEQEELLQALSQLEAPLKHVLKPCRLLVDADLDKLFK